ncbi:MAG TPA: hypothetical protein VKH19_17705 [Gemmatimonadaceae bacterium]|nr:hypothetical protein [Gemmatimonadaceae bacterium]
MAAKQKRSEAGASYNEFKEYEGRRYTGMKIGRSHNWIYDAGQWTEKKITPDLWQISYAVTKRRKGKAPEGSGVPVGTAYHWYIVAHQNVEKLNANEYTTSLFGLKFKVAHKRAGTEKWSATPRTQRKRMIQFLRDTIRDLEASDDAMPLEATATDAPARTSKPAARRPARTAPKRGIKHPPSMLKRVRRRRAAR